MNAFLIFRLAGHDHVWQTSRIVGCRRRGLLSLNTADCRQNPQPRKQEKPSPQEPDIERMFHSRRELLKLSLNCNIYFWTRQSDFMASRRTGLNEAQARWPRRWINRHAQHFLVQCPRRFNSSQEALICRRWVVSENPSFCEILLSILAILGLSNSTILSQSSQMM